MLSLPLILLTPILVVVTVVVPARPGSIGTIVVGSLLRVLAMWSLVAVTGPVHVVIVAVAHCVG
jgi:hypothetical protein